MQKAQFCLLTYKVTPCRLQSIQGLLINQASWQAAPRILAEEEKALTLPTQHFNSPQLPFDSFEDSDTNTDKIQSPKETKTQATESPKDTKTESETSNLISQNTTENKTKTQESTVSEFPKPPSADKVEKASFGEQSPTPETLPLLQNTPADKALLKIAQVLVTHLEWVDVDNLLFRHPEVLEAAGIATVETIKILREAGYLELPDPYAPFKRVVEKGGLLYLKYSKKAALIIGQAIQEAYPAQAKGIYEISATVPLGTASSIAEEFKKVRNSLGLSQEQLAQKLGVSRTLVSMVELGQREVEAEVLEKLRALSGKKLK
jgi:DNA-binding XRE family transcriptional regulator